MLLVRRALLAAASASLILPSRPGLADGVSSAAAVVTDKVRLEFVEQVSAQESRSLAMTIGLFGKDAPTAVSTFKEACSGTLVLPCPSDVDVSDAVMERSKQSKKATLKACLGSENEPVSYAYSQVWAVQRGKRINAGAVQGKFAMRVAPTYALSEAAGLSHDASGLLSVKRGGGSFDFGITTAPTPDFDDEFIVIGRVLEGADAVAALDALPVVKAADVLGVAPPTASRASACEYSNPQPFCAQNKPLKKVTLLRTAVL